jgi:endogenous inhibitor of DNA gyrase (YacG/DUF329 family)
MTDERKAEPTPPRPRRLCPICGRPATPDAYPFCSRRCADIDLNRWLSGAYAIPGASEEEEGGEETGESGQGGGEPI